MTLKIDSKITSYKVLTNQEPKEQAVEQPSTVNKVEMRETLDRPEYLVGATYKIKPPSMISEHAFYVTINDIILNEGTEHEERRPFEIFINTKDMTHFQWILALTRIMSAVFRKGGEFVFLIDELLEVFDPKGGYFKKGGLRVNSLVSEIGLVVRQHLINIGYIKEEGLSEEKKAYIESKKSEITAKMKVKQTVTEDTDGFVMPDNAQVCPKCSVRSYVLMDGCFTCLSCGESKCG